MRKNSFAIFGGITFMLSYLYFRLFAPQLMSYQIEQGAIFSYTKEFILGTLFKFGGPAELFSKFIMQSYINPWLGSLALALFMVFIAYRIFTISEERYSISIFLLVISTSYIILSQGILTSIIALSMVIFTFEDQEEAQLPNWLWLFRGIAFPILLWASGSWAWIYLIAIFPWDIIKGRKITSTQLLFALYSIILATIAYFFVWPITLSNLLIKSLPIQNVQGVIVLVGGLFSIFYSSIIKKESKLLKISIYIVSLGILLYTTILS